MEMPQVSGLTVELKVERCFESLSFDRCRAVRLRECLAPLVACMQALARQTPTASSSYPTYTPSARNQMCKLSPHTLLECLAAQLSDPRHVADMLASTEKAGSKGASLSLPPSLPLPPPPAERQALVVRLYQLFMDECAACAPSISFPPSSRSSSFSPSTSAPLPQRQGRCSSTY